MKRKTKGENILRALLKYLRNYKKETVLAPLFKLLEASFELFVPLVMAAIIDHGIGQADGVYVLKMGGVLIALGLIGLVCSITAQYFAAKAATGFSTELRHELFEHIQKLSFSFFDSRPTGKILSRIIGDINSLKDVLSNSVTTLIPDMVTVIAVVVIMFSKNAKLAAAALISTPLMVFGVVLLVLLHIL